jgi:hypothetical protein
MEMLMDDLADVGPADKVVQSRWIHLRVLVHASAWGLCLGLFLFVVPKIEAIFKDFGAPLPRKTAFVIALAHRVIRYQHLIVVGLILIIAGAEWFMRVALSDQANNDSCRRLSRLLVVAPLVLIVLALIALSIPLFTLTTPLSGGLVGFSVTGLITPFPFDVAADAGPLIIAHGLAGKHGIKCCSQVLAGDRDRVPGPAAVQLAPIDKLLIPVEDVEIGRASRLIGEGDLLGLIIKVRERVADLGLFPGHHLRTVVGMGGCVIRANADNSHALVLIFLAKKG